MTERRRLAHDLRNGMNTIVLNAQCLRISTGEELVECLDAIITASDLVIARIDELADLPEEIPTSPPV